MRILKAEIPDMKKMLKYCWLIALFFMPLISLGQTRDTSYFNPLIEDIVQRIPPLEDLIDSAIIHNPEVKMWDAEIMEWGYKVKSASRIWMRNFWLDTYLESGFLNYNTATSLNNQVTPDHYYSAQNNLHGIGYIEIKLPMLDLWDRKNQMKINTKEIEKAMAQKDYIILRLRQEIITNYNQLIVNQKILKNANESVIAGTLNKEMSDKEFLNGQTTLYDLAYIMEMYRVAVYNYETSRNAFYNSYMMLQELCGFKFNVINKIE
jgi:outer membrane protein TolC